MRYTMTFPEARYVELTDHLFADRTCEAAAYLLCKLSVTDVETRLLVRRVVRVTESDIYSASGIHVSIKPHSFLGAMKEADRRKEAFVFVHSHPSGFPMHSSQDDREEPKLFSTAYVRIHGGGIHGSLVLSEPNLPKGRVWLPDGTNQPIEVVRVIGERFRFYFHEEILLQPFQIFDRQVRAFGHENQHLLSCLTIGVVGVGGTGSAVAEELIRLGIGTIMPVDGQNFERTNINRVYGSRLVDYNLPKVKLTERLAADVGLKTRVIPINRNITYASAMKELRACDIVFGCTDDEWGRSLLTTFAIHYCIPVFDLGVKIDSNEGMIRSIQGRVTTLMPSTACLFCRARISSKRVADESKTTLNPAEAATLRAEGYIPELEDPSPAVIPFTTGIAAVAVSELLHRLVGFLGTDRKSSEVIYQFDLPRIRTNATAADPTCFCSDDAKWCLGDRTPFLETVWRSEG